MMFETQRANEIYFDPRPKFRHLAASPAIAPNSAPCYTPLMQGFSEASSPFQIPHQIAGVPLDTKFRLGTLLGIHKALRYMFTDPARAYEWVRKPNTAFGGKSALDRMLQGAPTDLAAVRSYLDAERAGW